MKLSAEVMSYLQPSGKRSRDALGLAVWPQVIITVALTVMQRWMTDKYLGLVSTHPH